MIENIARIYGTKDKLDSKGHVFKFLCNQINDLRDFKLIINNVISYTYFEKKQKLYIEDLIAINYIKFFNYSLYLEILKEKDYFIKYDNTNYDGYYSIETQENADVKKEKYFNNLFKNTENEKYKLLLAEMFSISNIIDKMELNSIDDNIEHDDINYKKRISSGIFFDLYFTDINNNEYIQMRNILDEFVDSINNEANIDEHKNIFFKTLEQLNKKFDQVVYKEYFKNLCLFIKDLNKEAQYSLLEIIFFDFYQIYNMNADKGRGVYSSLIVIIYKILQKIQDKHFNEFLDNIKNEYNKLLIIRNLTQQLGTKQFNKSLENRYKAIKKVYEEIGHKILNNNINLYDELYYQPENIWGLMDITISKGHGSIRDYTEKIVNEQNIYRVLYDTITIYGSNSIKYGIEKSIFEKLLSEEIIDKLLLNAKPKTETEEFILEIYKDYKNRTNENESNGLKNYKNIDIEL